MKKIIWIAAECPFPPNSGGRFVTWNRLNVLSKKFEIYLFCSIDTSDEIHFINDLKKICKVVFFYKRKKNIASIIKSIIYPFPVVTRYDKGMKGDINQLNTNTDIQWIIVDFPQMLQNVPRPLLNKTIINQHNIEYKALFSITRSIKNPLKKFIFWITATQMKLYEERIYKKNEIAYYTFVSSNEKKCFENIYQLKNTMLLPIGSSCIKSNETKSNEHNIIFVGKMSYAPNEEAIKWFVSCVWPQVKKKIPDVKFYIVGKDPSESLRNLNKIDKNVITTGMVESVDAYYDRASVVVVPIISGGGVNVKTIEALGKGNLVVSTSKGIEGTDFVSGKHLFVADSAETFAEKVIEAVQNPKNEMKEQAYHFCQVNYSWDAVCAPLIDFIST